MHKKPSREEAESAIRTLLEYIGENPDRDGLKDTPKRVINSYTELFAGYNNNYEEILDRTFDEIEGYEEMIVLRDIRLESFCEHHMLPIIGTVIVGYMPDKKVVGISKVARIVDIFSKRLQIQEKLTAQIAHAINEVLKPKGVGVVVEAYHHCMSTRGVHKTNSLMQTSHMLGCFKEDQTVKQEFMNLAFSFRNSVSV